MYGIVMETSRPMENLSCMIIARKNTREELHFIQPRGFLEVWNAFDRNVKIWGKVSTKVVGYF